MLEEIKNYNLVKEIKKELREEQMRKLNSSIEFEEKRTVDFPKYWSRRHQEGYIKGLKVCLNELT